MGDTAAEMLLIYLQNILRLPDLLLNILGVALLNLAEAFALELYLAQLGPALY